MMCTYGIVDTFVRICFRYHSSIDRFNYVSYENLIEIAHERGKVANDYARPLVLPFLFVKFNANVR